MSDWTPKEIDQLFQDGSTKYEFEYNEAAWSKMEVLLDDRDRRKNRLLWWFIGGLLSLLLIGGVYFFKSTIPIKQTYQTIKTTSLKTTKKLANNESDEKDIIKENLPYTNKAIIVQNSVKTLTAQSIQKENTSFNNAVSKTVQSKNKHVISSSQAAQTATTIVNPRTVLPSLDANQLASEVTFIGEKISNHLLVDSSVQQLAQGIAATNTLTLAAKKRGTQVTVDALPTLSNRIDFFDASILMDTTFLKETEKKTAKQNKVSGNHFVVGLLMGQELSFADVGLCTPNWKTGLSLAYRFGGKHSLKIEGNYVKKDYAASGEKYIAPQGFWEDGIRPQMTIGSCNIIEISITESYFFKGHAARGFYVDAGLSSYFLLNERYDYNYETTNANQRNAWGTDNTSRHWFGIGEIAIGYNLPFSNKTSLQIAPYAQIPFTGIGHGQVKFFSTGIHMRYNFHLNK